MTWASFCDYYLMRELGQTDAIVRGYKLEHPMANDNHNFTYAACKRMGLYVQGGNWQYALDEVIIRLCNYGLHHPGGSRHPLRDNVRIRLNEWYIWDRIRTGEIRKWRVADQISIV